MKEDLIEKSSEAPRQELLKKIGIIDIQNENAIIEIIRQIDRQTLTVEELSKKKGITGSSAGFDLGELKVYINGDEIPEKWRDVVGEHEAAEMIFAAKKLLDAGLPLRQPEQMRFFEEHSRALPFEYRRAIELGRLDEYQEWVRGLYQNEVENEKDSEKKQKLQRWLDEREEVFNKTKEHFQQH